VNGLYLKTVAISEFRPYGPAFKLDLPGPGVTLLVGPNGLGKTAFFEAIEWALTGQVERLARLPKDVPRRREYYGRIAPRRAGQFDCEVSLVFGGPRDGTVGRRVKYDADGSPADNPQVSISGAKTISDLLRNPNWPRAIDSDSLVNYLRATHLLSQAVSLRMSNDEPKHRWQHLSPLNGADLITKVQERLLGRATTNALKRARDQASQRVEECDLKLKTWLSLVEARNGLRARSMAAGALDGDAAHRALLALSSDIRSLGPRELRISDDVDATCAAFDEAIASAERRLASKTTQLSGLEAVVSKWAQEGARRDSTASAKVNAVAEYDALAKQEGELRSVWQAERKRVEELRARRDEIQRRIAALDEVVQALVSLQRIAQDAATLDREVGEQAETVRANQAALDEVAREEASRKSIIERLKELRTRREEIEQIVLEARDINKARAEREASTDEIAARRTANEQARQRLNDLKRAKTDAIERLDRARAQAKRAREHADAVSSLVGRLAALISETDKQCPVCAQEWPDGELKRNADSAARAMNSGVASSEAEVQTASARLREVEEQQTQIERQLASGTAEIAVFEDQGQKIEARRRALTDHSLFNETARPDDPIGYLEGLLSRTLESIQRCEDELASMRPFETVQADRASVGERQDRAITTLASAKARLEQLAASRREADTVVAKNPLLVDLGQESEGSRDQRRALLISELNREALDLESAERVDAEARRTLNRCSEDVAQKKATVASLEATVQVHDRGLAKALEEWRAAQLDGDPSADVLAAAMRQTREAQNSVASARERLRQINEAITLGRDAQELQKRELEIADVLKEVGVTSEDACSNNLKNNLQNAANTAKQWQTTSARVDRFRELLRNVVDHYYKEVTVPINGLERRYADALSIRAPFYVEMSARRMGGSALLELEGRFAGLPGGTQSAPLSAIHVLSEGQMAATALSQLLSMSTAYPWSDWRALLLDDPAQYSDVLHIAAFIDVLRNLVREQEYQIVLSTHDAELADFVRRKLSADQVPLTICHFEALSDDGVRYQVDGWAPSTR